MSREACGDPPDPIECTHIKCLKCGELWDIDIDEKTIFNGIGDLNCTCGNKDQEQFEDLFITDEESDYE